MTRGPYDTATARQWPDEEPAPSQPCPHRRVDPHGQARLVKGPPPTEARSSHHSVGYHLVQSGRCLDCGWPVIRFSPSTALGPWEPVADGAAPLPRRRRHGERY